MMFISYFFYDCMKSYPLHPSSTAVRKQNYLLKSCSGKLVSISHFMPHENFLKSCVDMLKAFISQKWRVERLDLCF